MRILVATDAWHPQVNGVVRTYERLAMEVEALGAEIAFLTPSEFRTWACPTYNEIQLALPGYAYVIERLDVMRPDAVHIATEGPIGWMTRAYCVSRRVPFTTSFHTRFPEYLSARFHIPASLSYGVLKRFHNAGTGMMVATRSLATELEGRGFQRIMPWTRGVDTQMFRPRPVRRYGSDQPVLLYVGRVAVEKNIAAFLDLDVPGRKVVVGTGPMLEELRARYPHVVFTGKLTGEALAESYASADVFVFPSRTDTFGIVLLEAIASGVPVAAYPVTGPLDNVVPGVTGALSENLGEAVSKALLLDRAKVRNVSLDLGWDACARLFLSNVELAIFQRQGKRAPARRKRLARRPQVSRN